MRGTTVALMLAGCLLWGCARAPLPQAAAGGNTATLSPTPEISEAIQVDLHGKPDFALVPPGQATVGLRVFQADIGKDHLKLIEGGTTVVVQVKHKKDGLVITDAKGKPVLRMHVKNGAPLRFMAGDNRVIYQAKSRALPLQAVSADGVRLGTVSVQNGGLEWCDDAKKLKARVSSTAQPELGLVLPLEKLQPEQRAALALYLLTFKP